MLYISFGSLAWWAVIAISLLTVFAMNIWLRRKPKEKAQKILLILCYFLCAVFVIQRVCIFYNHNYLSLYGNSFNAFIEQLLPLNLCYVSLVFAIVGLQCGKKYLLSFCFYISTFGALLALFAPDGCYTDISLLNASVFLNYFIHAVMLGIYFNIGLLDLFKPGFKAAAVSLGMITAVAGIIHIINLLGRALGFATMNYFYTVDSKGIALAETLWQLIPIPFVYIFIPGLILFSLWELIMSGLYLLKKLLARRTKHE